MEKTITDKEKLSGVVGETLERTRSGGRRSTLPTPMPALLCKFDPAVE